MSTTAPGAGGGPKQQLLERARGYLAEHGIGDSSLRELAAALGTSHRMLNYHFGSKEGPLMRLFFELYGQALQGGQPEFPLPAWSCNHGDFADQPESSGRHRLRRRDVHEHPGRDDRQRGPADHRP